MGKTEKLVDERLKQLNQATWRADEFQKEIAGNVDGRRYTFPEAFGEGSDCKRLEVMGKTESLQFEGWLGFMAEAICFDENGNYVNKHSWDKLNEICEYSNGLFRDYVENYLETSGLLSDSKRFADEQKNLCRVKTGYRSWDIYYKTKKAERRLLGVKVEETSAPVLYLIEVDEN